MGAAVLRQCLRRSHLLLLLLRLLLEKLVVRGEGVGVGIVVDDAVGECDLEVVLGGCGAEVGLQEVLDVAVLFCGCGDGCSWARLGLLLLLLREEGGVGGVGVVLGDGVVNCCWWGHWGRRGWVDEGEVAGEEVCEVVAGGVGPLLLAGLGFGCGRGGDEVCG